MVILKLFWSFFQVGLFSIGGGLAALPLIQQQIVSVHDWLTLSEFTDLITIAEMTPGPIAINSATFVGLRIAGITGALTATFGCILAPCIIVSLLTLVYFKYRNMQFMQTILATLRPAVVALIASAGLTILIFALFGDGGFKPDLSAVNYVSAGLFGAALIVLKKWNPSPILVMFGCGVVGRGNIFLIG
jgi:chromate transporter